MPIWWKWTKHLGAVLKLRGEFVYHAYDGEADTLTALKKLDA